MTYANHSNPIPIGLCQCGCGRHPSVLNGEPRRFVRGHCTRRDPMRMFVVDDKSSCWIWQGNIDEGYGRIGHKLAYRVIYERLRGPKPASLDFDHLCRNRACVNPDHLEFVTRKENARRGSATVLDPCGVYEIRELLLDGMKKCEIARLFGVTPGTISHIANGRTWTDVSL